MTVIKHETAHQFDRVATLVVPPSKGCAAAESGGHACGAAHAAMAGRYAARGGPLRGYGGRAATRSGGPQTIPVQSYFMKPREIR